MSDTDSEIWVSPIYGGMLRPATVMGVNVDVLAVAFFGAALVFVMSSPHSGFLSFGFFWFVGWVLCKIDSDIFTIMREASNLALCKNRTIYGCVYYEPY